jgi:hypothetical protein
MGHPKHGGSDEDQRTERERVKYVGQPVRNHSEGK